MVKRTHVEKRGNAMPYDTLTEETVYRTGTNDDEEPRMTGSVDSGPGRIRDLPDVSNELPSSTAEMEAAFGHLATELDSLIRVNRNPSFRSTLTTLRRLVGEIASFFRRIRELLLLDVRNGEERFVVRFFAERWSIVSENTRAARSILRYALHDPVWFASCAARMLDRLKSLYAELVSIRIECAEQYKRITGRELRFEFGSGRGARIEKEPEMSETEALETLGLEEAPNRDAIKSAFRKLAKKYHPDLNRDGGDEAAFVRIERAYRTLLSSIGGA